MRFRVGHLRTYIDPFGPFDTDHAGVFDGLTFPDSSGVCFCKLRLQRIGDDGVGRLVQYPYCSAPRASPFPTSSIHLLVYTIDPPGGNVAGIGAARNPAQFKGRFHTLSGFFLCPSKRRQYFLSDRLERQIPTGIAREICVNAPVFGR